MAETSRTPLPGRRMIIPPGSSPAKIRLHYSGLEAAAPAVDARMRFDVLSPQAPSFRESKKASEGMIRLDHSEASAQSENLDGETGRLG
jgi:hypothetical protein